MLGAGSADVAAMPRKRARDDTTRKARGIYSRPMDACPCHSLLVRACPLLGGPGQPARAARATGGRERAEAELRAVGAGAPAVAADDPLARLTPQELQVV